LCVLCENHFKAKQSECPVIVRNLSKGYVHVTCQSYKFFFGLPLFLECVRQSVYRKKIIEDRCMDLLKFNKAKMSKQ
jgi:hypothetical protein